MNIPEVAKKLTVYLKQRKMQHLICNSCGYTQGHPINYCPKCPGKMSLITYPEYNYFIGLDHPYGSLWYKYSCATLLGVDYVTIQQWHDIVTEIKKEVEA